MATRYAGHIARSNTRGKGYGFLYSVGQAEEIFFHSRDVLPDIINRRGIPGGSPVSFEIGKGKDGRPAAVNVRNEDPALAEIDVNDCEEYGRVRTWNCSQGWGYLTRPSGDGLKFDAKHVIAGDVELITVGTWLHYYVGCVQNEGGSTAWFARDISICETEVAESSSGDIEAYFLQAEELPVEFVGQSAPNVFQQEVMPVSVWSDAGRKMSLRDLMERNKHS